jgi:hypothetical protein
MGYSLGMLMAYFEGMRVPGAKSQRLAVCRVETSMIGASRQIMVKKGLQRGSSHFLFLDSDMSFPRDTLHRLLAHRKPFVAANCTTRVEPILPVAHDLAGNRLDSRGKTGLQKVQHVGMAVALIEAECFRKTKPPHFLMDWIPDVQNYCGEDVYCSQVLQAAGYDSWVDHDLSREIGHVGYRTYTHQDVKELQDG